MSSTWPPNQPTARSSWDRPSSADSVQTLVATKASDRRGSSASARRRSACPYIGDESKTRTPSSSPRSTSAAGPPAAASKRSQVPSPTTGTA